MKLRTLICSLAAACGVFAAAVAPIPAQQADLQEILVTGEQPGPGMWRVSHGQHVLWILGTLSPLPKKMIWRSQQADATIARSQEVLAPPKIDVDIGFFRGLTLLPSLLHARKDPSDQRLKEVLPPAIYARWLPLKDRYLGSGSGVEKYRPILAARELYTHALDQSGLASADAVWKLVRQSAQRHGIPITPVKLDLELDDAKGTIKQLQLIPPDAEAACLSRTIERLETDLQSMRLRANLWALGDVQGLRKLPYADQRSACFDAVTSVPALGARVLALRTRINDLWLAAAKSALANNESTFAVLPITDIMKPDGWAARLRASGYEVQDP